MVDRTISPLSVAVVDDDPRLRTRLAMILGEGARAAAFASLEAVDNRRSSSGPLVLVLGPSFATVEALTDAGRRLRTAANLCTVLVVPQLTADLLQRAMRAGLSDVVGLEAAGTELAAAVERAADQLRVPATAPPVAEAAAPVVGTPARVTTVLSAKGGAGKSFVATNLAVLLARRSRRPVVLVDADLQFGDVSVMLGLDPDRTVIDAVKVIDGLDETSLPGFLVRHHTGLRVLAAPPEPAFADSVTLAHLRRLLDLMAPTFGHVVIDTPAIFDDIVLGAVARSDDVVVVAGMDVPNIKNTKIGLQTLRLLHVPAGKVKLVLNRADSKVRLDIADVERTLQMKADCLVPSDISVPQSLNKGVPVVIDAPRSPVARSLERLAALVPEPDPAAGAGARLP